MDSVAPATVLQNSIDVWFPPGTKLGVLVGTVDATEDIDITVTFTKYIIGDE